MTTSKFHAITIYSVNNNTPALSERLVGALLYQPGTDILGFRYDADYDGPPLDLSRLNYRAHGRNIVLGSKAPLPAVLRRALPDQYRNPVLFNDRPELREAHERELIPYIEHGGNGGLRFVHQDLNLIKGKAYLDIKTNRYFHNGLQTTSTVLGAMESGTAVQFYQLRPSHSVDRQRAGARDDNGEEWFLVLDDFRNELSTVRMEGLVLRTMERAGFTVAEQRFHVPIDSKHSPVLAIRRSDVRDGKRLHVTHAAELLGGKEVGSYRDLSELITSVSTNVDDDLRILAEAAITDLTFNVTRNDMAHLALAGDRDGYRILPLADRQPNPKFSRFCVVVTQGIRNLDSRNAMQALAQRTGIPANYLQSAWSQMKEALPSTPIDAAALAMTDAEWTSVRAAIEINQPTVAATLPLTITRLNYQAEAPSQSKGRSVP